MPDSHGLAQRDALIANPGVTFNRAGRGALVNGPNSGAETRATVLRKVAENEAFRRKEFNPAFVLKQYFGYLRRDPDGGPDTNSVEMPDGPREGVSGSS